jgi:hypothetical protein
MLFKRMSVVCAWLSCVASASGCGVLDPIFFPKKAVDWLPPSRESATLDPFLPELAERVGREDGAVEVIAVKNRVDDWTYERHAVTGLLERRHASAVIVYRKGEACYWDVRFYGHEHAGDAWQSMYLGGVYEHKEVRCDVAEKAARPSP